MKRLIIAILLISSVVALAAPPFALEQVVPVIYKLRSGTSAQMVSVPVVDYLQLQRIVNVVERKMRQMDSFRDSTFTQTDSAHTEANGLDTIYLPHKYENTGYFIDVTPVGTIGFGAVAISDSSFLVLTNAFDLTAISADYKWFTIGIRKK